MKDSDFIRNLRPGDIVYQIERNGHIPGGSYRWKGKVLEVTDIYVYVEYSRDWSLDWLIELCKDLLPSHRTYAMMYERNYFGPNGDINIEPYEK